MTKLLFITFAIVTACKTESNYCEDVPVTHNCKDKVDADTSCTSNAQCAGATPVCDVGGSKMCVQCTTADDAACSDATPVCGASKTCEGCTSHAQCSESSNVCLPDGACADAGQVAYVEAGKTGDCSKGTPCGSLAEGVGKPVPYIKVTGTLNAAATTTISKTVTILADPNASVDTSADATSVLTISTSAADVKIFDLKITGGTMAGGVGVSVPTGGTPTVSLTRVKLEGNTGGGLTASGGSVTVTQSTVSGNTGGGLTASGGSVTVTQSTVSGNTGGGISIMNTTFAVVGNVFFQNGSPSATVGGLSVTTSQNAANRLEFNSFNKNQTQDGLGTAIQCTAGAFTARNNIMSDNGTLSNMAQVGGTCMHTHSIARPGTLPPGAGNLAADPMFLNTTTGNLHVMPGSPALGAADPASNLTGPAEFDLDNHKRTNPADIGADELP
jgi:Right handed beta helix region